jgi:hypothetical protein
MPARRRAAEAAANPSLLPSLSALALRLVEEGRCRAARVRVVWLHELPPLRLLPPPLRLLALRLGLARPVRLVLEVEP